MRSVASSGLAACFVFVAALASCSSSNESVGGGGGGGGSEPAQMACDPLAPPPITLGKIIGVGEDAAGTLYVDAEKGIFVSSGDTLTRQRVTGTGESGTTEFLFIFEAPDGSGSTQSLLVETDGTTATKMAIGPDGLKGLLNESPPGITMLTVVPPSTVDGMKVANTPNVIQWIGDVANGDVIMGTVPENLDPDATGGLSIFYGPKSAVAQRQIVDFQRSGSTGMVTFLVAGTKYTLAFGREFAADAGPLSEFALQGLTPEGGAKMGTFIRKPTPASLPEGVSFTCLP